MSIVSTAYGSMRIIDLDQVVSRSLSLYGEWAEDELALLGQIIRLNSYVLDVGAFIGTHSLAFSKFVGPNGRVYSFEPRREIYAFLQENISINDCRNVTALNMGLGERTQTVSLPLIDTQKTANFGGLSLQEQSTSLDTYEIGISTIDDLDIEKIDFIKLDVEGMERRVLDGAVQCITQHHPVIFCECNSIQSGAELLGFCNDQQYKAYAFLASAYNPNNFNRIKENIFGDSKELTLLLVSKDTPEGVLGESILNRLLPIHTLEDLVLPLLHKPQYAHEVLANTAASGSLGIYFPSPLVAQYIEEITALKEGLIASQKEVARMRATVSWVITKPLRAIWNTFRSMLSAR